MSQTLWSTLWQQATRTGDAPLLKLYRSSSSSSTLSSSFQQDLPTVSYARFVDLSTACALMLRRQPDLSAALSSGPLRFAVLSENSLDLLVLIAACWKAAVAPLLLSPGLSADEWRRLCDAGGCRVLVVSRAMRGTLQEQTAVVIATLEELTDQQRVCFASEERHVVECGEDQVREDSVAMLLHTSGSTGHPKLVPLTHKALVANQRACRGVLESRWKSGEGSALWLPLCHGFALASEFLHALFAGGWCCLLETGSQPPQPQHVAEAVSRSGAAVLCAVPWMLTALRQLAASRGDRDSMHELAGLRLCLVGGAALACEDARWMAAQGVLVANLLGITELAGSIMFSSLHSSPSSSASSSLFSLPSSWKPASCLSLQLVPGLGGQMLPYSADGSFQLVFPRRASLTLFAGYLDCDSDLDVFHTRDLFLPSADAGWIHVGRTDFSFKSATGLESNPAVLEHAMQQCPGVARALLYGEAQQHNALLLELLPGVSRDPSRLQVLREHLQAANRAVAPHSRVPMHALALLPEGISLPTTPKGSIDRPRAILAFHKLLNGLYSPSSSSSFILESNSLEATIKHAAAIAGLQLRDCDASVPFSDLGLTSLAASSFRTALVECCASSTAGRMPPVRDFLSGLSLSQLCRLLCDQATTPAATPPSHDLRHFGEAMFIDRTAALQCCQKVLGLSEEQVLGCDAVTAVRRMCARLQARVPFQSVSGLLLLRSRERLPTLTEIRNDVARGIGGLCYVMNVFFGELLRALGFRVSYALATIHEVQECHVTVLLHDLKQSGDVWNVEAGCGHYLPEPVLLSFSGDQSRVYRHGHLRVRFLKAPGAEEPLLLRLHSRSSVGDPSEINYSGGGDPDFCHKFWAMSLRSRSLAEFALQHAAAFLGYRKFRAAVVRGGRMHYLKVDVDYHSLALSARHLEGGADRLLVHQLDWPQLCRLFLRLFPVFSLQQLIEAISNMVPDKSHQIRDNLEQASALMQRCFR